MHSTKGFFVTGTDTGIGKTLVSLGLCLKLKADYWKPIQTGPEKDLDFIQQFLPTSQTHKSVYSLKEPLSPNQAAQKEQVSIDLNKIKKPESRFLIVEGAGGVFVPLNKTQTQIDLITQLQLPAIVVARSGLGTLNHTLLTIEVLKNKNIQIKGIILSGPPHPLNKRDLENWSNAPILLELPRLAQITKQEILKAFQSFPASVL